MSEEDYNRMKHNIHNYREQVCALISKRHDSIEQEYYESDPLVDFYLVESDLVDLDPEMIKLRILHCDALAWYFRILNKRYERGLFRPQEDHPRQPALIAWAMRRRR